MVTGRPSGGFVQALFVAFGMACLVMLVLAGRFREYPLSSSLCAVLWAVVTFGFIQHRLQAGWRSTWPLEAQVLALLAFAAIFCVRPLAVMLFQPHRLVRVGIGYSLKLDDAPMAVALLVALVAVLAYLAGFTLSRGGTAEQPARRPVRRLVPGKAMFWGGALLLAGIVTGLTFLAQAGIGVSQMLESRGGWSGDASVMQRAGGYLFVGRLLCIPGLALFVMGAHRTGRRQWRLAALTAVVGVGAWMALFGSRLVVFFVVLLYLTIGTHVRRKQLSRPVLLGLLVAGYAGYLLAEVVRVNARYYAENPEEAYELTAERMKSVGGGDLLTFDRFVLLVEFFRKEKPYLYGETLYEAAVLPVPRALWPEKPLYGVSKHFYPTEAKSFFGANFSVVGELFANFGALGVAVGMLLLGRLMRRLDRVRAASEGDDMGFLVALALCMLVPYSVDASPWGILAVAGVFVGPVLLVGRLVSRET